MRQSIPCTEECAQYAHGNARDRSVVLEDEIQQRRADGYDANVIKYLHRHHFQYCRNCCTVGRSGKIAVGAVKELGDPGHVGYNLRRVFMMAIG